MEKIDSFKGFLQSIYYVPVIFIIAFTGWAIGYISATVIALSLFACLVLLFCDDVKNILAPIFFTPFYLQDLAVGADWTAYFIAIGLVVVSFAVFLFRKLKINKRVNYGNLRVPFILSTVAFLIGGINVNFDIINFVIILGFCAVCYLIYFISLNYTKDLLEYLCKMFIIGSLFVFAEYISLIARSSDISAVIIRRQINWIGAQAINTTAIYFMVSIVACFYLSFKKKLDWFYAILAELFFFGVFILFCRTVIALSFVCFVFMLILAIKQSNDRKKYVFALLISFLAFSIIFAVAYDFTSSLIEGIIGKIGAGANGRENLYKWCFERFLKYPVFGSGFVVNEDVPSVRNPLGSQLILAHNTVLQWAVSLGIIGLIIMCICYVYKYKILLKNSKLSDVFCIVSVIAIELSGMADQAAAMDVFIYLMSIIIIASLEREKIADKRLKINGKL